VRQFRIGVVRMGVVVLGLIWQYRFRLERSLLDAERHDKDGQSWCVMDCRDRVAIGPV
jgi:hypothetical protein